MAYSFLLGISGIGHIYLTIFRIRLAWGDIMRTPRWTAVHGDKLIRKMNSGAMQEVNCFACSTGMQYKMAMLFFSCCSIVLYEPRTTLAHGSDRCGPLIFQGVQHAWVYGLINDLVHIWIGYSTKLEFVVNVYKFLITKTAGRRSFSTMARVSQSLTVTRISVCDFDCFQSRDARYWCEDV